MRLAGVTTPRPICPWPCCIPRRETRPGLLLEKDVAINTADKEGFFYQKLDLQKLGLPPATGLYLLDITHAKKSVCSWLLVTDTALIVKRAKSQMVVFAADMETGVPICRQSSANVSKRARDRVGATDARGVAQITVPAVKESQESDSTRVTTVAMRGEDEAVVSATPTATKATAPMWFTRIRIAPCIGPASASTSKASFGSAMTFSRTRPARLPRLPRLPVPATAYLPANPLTWKSGTKAASAFYKSGTSPTATARFPGRSIC